MASASRGNGPAVSDRLFQEPWQFDFFQSVRLLERMAWERWRDHGGPLRFPVGGDQDPAEEVVRFRSPPTFGFPPAQIVKLSRGPDPSAPAEMHVAFLGLIGATGVLPQHYTQMVIDRVRHRDFALREFLDLFEHRIVSLFYRAWEKYRFPVGYERAALAPQPRDDPFTSVVYALSGLGTRFLRGRLRVDDEAFLYYSGHFTHWPRSAVVLDGLLSDYFEVPARILQFRGQWLYLRPADQSRLPMGRRTRGLNNRLGQDVVVGERVWNVESKFRVRLGPLTYRQFLRFLPTADGLQPLAQFVRMYVGKEYDFDVQAVLLAAEVPECRLGGNDPAPSRLGWNTWLVSRAPHRDAEQAVFVHEGLPSD